MINLSSVATRVFAAKLGVLAMVAIPTTAMTDRAAMASTAVPARASAPAIAVEAALPSALESAGWTGVDLRGVNPTAFDLALRAASAAVERGDVAEPHTLTVIDFSRRSTEKRLWVFDLRSRAVLFDEVVSHGRGSGMALATAFSNRPESNQSSLGLYRTAETYVGKHGYSLRLDGLEAGVNDRARERAIVMHAADYVDPVAARAQGYLGRSLGCPALRPAVSRQLIDAVKNGGLLFAYYPDQEWLGASEYLN